MEQNLSIDTLIIAKEELREDETTRNNALAQMRLWLKQNKKIIHSRSGKYKIIYIQYFLTIINVFKSSSLNYNEYIYHLFILVNNVTYWLTTIQCEFFTPKNGVTKLQGNYQ